MIVTGTYGADKPELDLVEVAECIVCGDPMDYCTGHGPLGAAVGAVQDDADEQITAFMRKLVTEGRARWEYDQEVPGCYGLIVPGTNKALALAYGPDHLSMLGSSMEFDWEISDEFCGMMSEDENSAKVKP